jgi:HEAT repeat protein
MARYYYEHKGERFGPFSSGELKQVALDGKILPDDLILTESLDKRVPAHKVSGLLPPGEAVATRRTKEHVSPEVVHSTAETTLQSPHSSDTTDQLRARLNQLEMELNDVEMLIAARRRKVWSFVLGWSLLLIVMCVLSVFGLKFNSHGLMALGFGGLVLFFTGGLRVLERWTTGADGANAKSRLQRRTQLCGESKRVKEQLNAESSDNIEIASTISACLQDLATNRRRRCLRAIKALALLAGRTDAALEALCTALQNPKQSIRLATVSELAFVGSPAVPLLSRALSDEDAEIRKTAAQSLGKIGAAAAEAIVPLIALLNRPYQRPSGSKLTKEDQARNAAADALGKIGPAAADAVPSLINVMRDGRNRGFRHCAQVPLERIGAAAIPALIEALNTDTEVEFFHSSVADVLRNIGPTAVPVSTLIHALHHKELGVREFAARALRRIGPAATEAIPALVDALSRESSPVLESVIKALGAIGPDAKSAASALQALRDSKRGGAQIQKCIDSALKRINGQ